MATPSTARVREKTMLRPDVVRVDLEMVEPAEVRYAAGQYVILHTAEENGKVIKRSYSIASAPSPAGFSLCVKVVGNASRFVSELNPGDIVKFSGPWGAGKFTFPAETANEIVMAASGTGISPMMSHLASHLPAHPENKFLLIWGLKNESQIFGRDDLDALAARHPNFSYRIILSEPSDAWTGLRGKLSEKFLPEVGEPAGKEFFLAGNGTMIAAVEAGLKSRGVPPEKIHKEIFFLPMEG